MKTCSTCNNLKPLTEFYRNKATNDGLQYDCKACRKIESKLYKRRMAAKKKKEDQAAVMLEPVTPDQHADIRPRSYRDCLPGGINEQRPCPWWACPHHLAVEHSRTIKANWSRMKRSNKFLDGNGDAFVEALSCMPDTCELDIEARGRVTLEEIGGTFGCVRERVRQIEVLALRKARRNSGEGSLALFTEEEVGYYEPLRGR